MSDRSPLDRLNQAVSRRRFFLDGSIAAFVAGVASACKTELPPSGAAAGQVKSPAGPTGGTMSANDTASGANRMAAADAMDAMHEKRVKAFPAKTSGTGNMLLTPTMDGETKVFE